VCVNRAKHSNQISKNSLRVSIGFWPDSTPWPCHTFRSPPGVFTRGWVSGWASASPVNLSKTKSACFPRNDLGLQGGNTLENSVVYLGLK
jgi:hypothetical protein